MEILYVKGVELSTESLRNINSWIVKHNCMFTSVKHIKSVPYVTCYVIGVPDEKTKKSLLSEFSYREVKVSDIKQFCPEALEIGRVMLRKLEMMQKSNQSTVDEIKREKTKSLYRKVDRILRHMESDYHADKVLGYLPSAAVEFSNEDLEEVVRYTVENVL